MAEGVPVDSLLAKHRVARENSEEVTMEFQKPFGIQSEMKHPERNRSVWSPLDRGLNKTHDFIFADGGPLFLLSFALERHIAVFCLRTVFNMVTFWSTS